MCSSTQTPFAQLVTVKSNGNPIPEKNEKKKTTQKTRTQKQTEQIKHAWHQNVFTVKCNSFFLINPDIAHFKRNYLVQYDGKTCEQLERLWQHYSCRGKEHVARTCAHIAHDKNESSILQSQKHQTQVLQKLWCLATCKIIRHFLHNNGRAADKNPEWPKKLFKLN